MSPRPGEVWLADLGMAAKTRPVVVASNTIGPMKKRAFQQKVPQWEVLQAQRLCENFDR